MDDAGHLLSSSAPIKRACTLRSRTWLAPPKAIFQFPMGQRFALAQQFDGRFIFVPNGPGTTMARYGRSRWALWLRCGAMKLRLPAFAISTMPLFPFWAKLNRVIARNVLVSFSGKHPEAKVSLEGWHTIMEAAQWRSTYEVQKAAPKAKVLNRERAR